jgi:peptidoglycan/LPS O-acetylase OafA/YrhL
MTAVETVPLRTAGPGTRFGLIDSVRALAAMAVIVVHSYFAADLSVAGYAMSWMAMLGWTSMAVFFTISGFAMYRPFLVAHVNARSVDWGAFARRRVARIFPPWWLLLTVAAIWPGIGNPYSADWAKVWGILQFYGERIPTAADVNHSWSLGVELLFYVSLPVLVWLGSRTPGSLIGPMLVVETIFLASAAANLFVPPITAQLPWVVFVFVGGVGMQIALGMALAIVSVGWSVNSPPLVLGFLARRPVLCWLLAVAGAIVLISFKTPTYEPPHAELLPWRVLTGVVGVLLLLPTIFRSGDSDPVRRFLASRPLVWMGERSYGIYLWHFPISLWVVGSPTRLRTNPLLIHIQDVIPGPDLLVVFGATLALTLPMAALSYALFERPLMEWAKRDRVRVPVPALVRSA